MKKNFYVLIILYILVLLTLAGCEKTPQEVKDKIDVESNNASSKKNVNSNKDLDYDTVENIYKTIDEVKSKSYDNLEFSHKFEINKPDQIGEMKFHQINNFLDKDDEIVNDFIGDSFDKKYLKREPTRPSTQYDDKSKQLYCGMLNNGFYSYGKNNGYHVVSKLGNSIKEVEEISLMQEYDDKTYKLTDGPMKISEAVKIAQNEAERLQVKYNDMKCIPTKVIIFKQDDGTYLYRIYFAKSYKNVYFSYIFPKDWNLKMPYIVITGANVMIDSHNSPIVFANTSGIIEYVETIQDYDKIITFECATKLLSNMLSSYKKYEVQYVSLKNRLILKSNLVTGKAEYNAYNFDPDNIYETKPCWTFYLDVTPDSGVYAMVDCITGEIEFINNNN